jgi:hypothetical protein
MRILAIILGLIMPLSAAAVTFPACPIGSLSCEPNLAGKITTALSLPASFAFAGFIFAMIVFYAGKLLLSSGEENEQTEVKASFGQAIIGSIFVAGAFFIANSFTQFGAEIVDETLLETRIFNPILGFFMAILATALLVTMTIQGARMILAQDESQFTTARTRFIQALIGVAIVVLAVKMVAAFNQTNNPNILPTELAGITKFLATLVGFFAVISILAGGVMLVVSANDTLKERAKKSILAGVVTLIVVFMSYSIVVLFINL